MALVNPQLQKQIEEPFALVVASVEQSTTLPGNVLTEGLSSYIKSFTRSVLTPARVVEIEDKLQALTGRIDYKSIRASSVTG